MTGTSTQSESLLLLGQKLDEQIQKNREMIEKATAEELRKLGENLSRQSQAVLHTTKSDMERESKELLQSLTDEFRASAEVMKKDSEARVAMIINDMEKQSTHLRQHLASEYLQFAKYLSKHSKATLATTIGNLQNQSNEFSRNLTTSLEQAEIETQVFLKKATKQKIKMLLVMGLLCLSLLPAIAIGSWGVLAYLSNQHRSLLEERDQARAELHQLKKQTEQEQTTLSLLQSKTWGLSLQEEKKEKFIVLPVGWQADATWKVGSQIAIKIWR